MSNKELIYVTAFCPTEEQEIRLERCINALSNIGYDIAIVSHTHIPFHIQKKCQYYIYDHLNDISDDDKLLSLINFSFSNCIINSRYFQKNFYGFAILRMINLISNLAINFKYEKIHYVEYDVIVEDPNLFKENSKLLDTYDSILYTHGGNKEGGLIGGLHSCRVDKLPDLFKNYDRDMVYESISTTENMSLEDLVKSSFLLSGNVLFVDKNSLHNYVTFGEDFMIRNVHYTLFYDGETNLVNIFYKNILDRSVNVMVVVDDSGIINFRSEQGHWNIRSVGNINEIKKIAIYIDDKLSHVKYFSDDNIEIFKRNSYINRI